ncbi:putative type VI secretion system effector [Trinickia sp. EG282A]|uniref:putative type VI secretion system effector n=1 Tax=Trinickia sp. EG282A TaxID=3237013 RepID=UPI0034D2FBC3
MQKIKPDISTVLLCGRIANLQRSRRSHDFVLSQAQQWQVSVTGLGAAAMGMGAAGIGLINMAANSDEEADWVEFELDGKHIEGWLWMMPMRNGDKVEVVAQQAGENQYLAFAVRRESDDLLAVYPHATAGRKAHYKNMMRIMLWTFCIVYPISIVAFYLAGNGFGGDPVGFFSDMTLYGAAGLIVLIAIFYRTGRKLMSFAHLAETIFRAYGWPDVEKIDLRKTSRENRRENKLPNYGNYYFRYK